MLYVLCSEQYMRTHTFLDRYKSHENAHTHACALAHMSYFLYTNRYQLNYIDTDNAYDAYCLSVYVGTEATRMY